ncbi:hypothetical protein Ddye_013983, partial [Dipteronia dyeriana]
SSISLQEAQYLLLNHEQRIAQRSSTIEFDISVASANFVTTQGQNESRTQRGGSSNYNVNNRSGNRDRNRGRGRAPHRPQHTKQKKRSIRRTPYRKRPPNTTCYTAQTNKTEENNSQR